MRKKMTLSSPRSLSLVLKTAFIHYRSVNPADGMLRDLKQAGQKVHERCTISDRYIFASQVERRGGREREDDGGTKALLS
jgi:hypothetical protein